jgi:hypothetical protein
MIADQGDFFFADVLDSKGDLIGRPVFIVGKHGDSNDGLDVIVCKCTTQPAKSAYDIKVQLKSPTFVRTNKVTVIGRDQLKFRIHHKVDSEMIDTIVESVVRAVHKKQIV